MEVRKVDASEITHAEFIEKHWKPGIPLVFKNATKVWGAYNTFTPDWFRANYGTRKTLVNEKEYTMAEIMDLVLAWTGRRRLVAWLPPALVDLQARLLELLPVPPLTRDQVKLLGADNVCYGKAPGLAELGIAPTPAEAIVPGYLARFRRASKKGRPVQAA